MQKRCDYNGNPLPPPDFANCVALLQAAKISAQWRTSSSLGVSLLEKSEQQLMDAVIAAIDEAVLKLQHLQEVVR